jgi:ElaB/YqjD/DUF883 family membrane-anchored ribosome-binding protein
METMPVEAAAENAPQHRADTQPRRILREIEATRASVEREIDRLRLSVRRQMEDSTEATRRLVRRGRYAAADYVEAASHQVKKHPVGSMAIAFAAGAVLTLLLPRPGKK